MIGRVPDRERREPQARALAAVRPPRRLQRVRRRHRPEHTPGVRERLAQVRIDFVFCRGGMWPAAAAAGRRLLLLDFVEECEVGARYVLDLLAEGPDIGKLAVRRLER